MIKEFWKDGLNPYKIRKDKTMNYNPVVRLNDLLNTLILGRYVDENTNIFFNAGKKYRITYDGKITKRFMEWLEKYGHKVIAVGYVIYKENNEKRIVIGTW